MLHASNGSLRLHEESLLVLSTPVEAAINLIELIE